ncbi:MAG TPA: IS1595 family transposase [Verrucomicrobiae bacterium]|nr:IS1595 family transposase [Verrucomicrobiae bacterium]
MRTTKNTANLGKSEIISEIPLTCSDELAAVEFLETRLWKGQPKCHHCQSANIYKMVDAKTGQRNKRFLWRCHDCKGQFTVRLGTVFEESRLPLRHWCYAFWRASTSKKGVSALEIQRQCQISYKSALFLMHRIRHAMTPDLAKFPKMSGTVEVDETYIGGKKKYVGRGSLTGKTPVVSLLERGGRVHSKVMPCVNGNNLKAFVRKNVAVLSEIHTDENRGYCGVRSLYEHHTVKHAMGEYARREKNRLVTTNSVEGFFSLLKRGITGIYHAVSKEHLHRYLGEFDFRYNARYMNDGERTELAIQSAQGKRLSGLEYRA